MDQKIDKLMQQHEQYQLKHKKQHEEQEQVTTTVTNQLHYLVENMKSILKYTTLNTSLIYPLPKGDGKL